MQIEAPTAKGTGPASLRIWKDGVLRAREAPDNYTETEPHRHQLGYLLGWANTGFDQDTYLFVDDVCFVATP